MKTLLTLLLIVCAMSARAAVTAGIDDAFVNAKSFGLIAGGTVANGAANKAAIQAAINSLGNSKDGRAAVGGTVLIPCGFYYVDPGIMVTHQQKGITITGCSSGFSYQQLTRVLATYQSGTVIAWAKGGEIGFDFSKIDYAAPDGNYTFLTNMVIVGTSALPVKTCVKVSGIAKLSELAVEGCTDHGIWLFEFINSTVIDHVSVTNNLGAKGYGLLVGPQGASFHDNTLFHVTNSVFRANRVGVRIEQANNYKFDHFVIESNTGEGLMLYKTATPAPTIDGGGALVGKGHDQNRNAVFDTGVFENNGSSSNVTNNIVIDSATRAYSTYDVPSYILFNNITSVGYETTTHGKFKPNIRIDAGQFITFANSQISTPDAISDGASKSLVALGKYAANVRFDNTSGNPVFTNSGTSNNVLDHYDQGSFKVSVSGCATPTNGTAYYVRIGRQVTIDFPTMSCVGDRGTSRVLAGMPASLNPPSAKRAFIRSRDNVTTSIGMGEYSGTEVRLYKDGTGSAWTVGSPFTIYNFSFSYSLN